MMDSTNDYIELMIAHVNNNDGIPGQWWQRYLVRSMHLQNKFFDKYINRPFYSEFVDYILPKTKVKGTLPEVYYRKKSLEIPMGKINIVADPALKEGEYMIVSNSNYNRWHKR